MITRTSALLLAACGSLLLAGCSNSSNSGSTDLMADQRPADVDARTDLVSDLGPQDSVEPVDQASDLRPDSAPDADAVGDISVPGPEFTFEVRQHSNAIQDLPYQQDTAHLIRNFEGAAAPNVTRVASTDEGVWAATDQGEVFLRSAPQEPFVKIADAPFPDVTCLLPTSQFGLVLCSGMSAYALTSDGLYEQLTEVPGPVLSAFPCKQNLFILHAGSLCSFDGDQCAIVDSSLIGTVLSGACLNDLVYLGTDTGLWRQANDQTFTSVWTPPGTEPVVAVAGAGSTLAAASLSTVALLDQEGLLKATHSALDGTLPAKGNTSVALDPTGTRWAVGQTIGVSSGAVGSDAVEHFHSLRYLPGEHVNGLLLTSTDTLVAACNGGLSFLTKETTSLSAKADGMLAYLDQHFWRLGGFVSPEGWQDDPWAPTSTMLEDNDNDGQWTQEALGAFCFAYATTHDAKYLQAARKALGNMFLLQDIPALDFVNTPMGPGFVSRSVVRDDEGEIFANKATQANWHLVHFTDGHDYYWKDDTSSDETTGHFFGWPFYYDLCAQDDQERALVADHIVALAGTILDQGFQLVDLDGLPTEHGYWQPERLAIAVDGLKDCVDDGHTLDQCGDAYFGSAYLNSVEILGALLSAWHVSGEPRFLEAYESLITEYRYDELATFSEYVMTWTQPGVANYCDHELADLAFLTLLRYEPNAQRRQLWVQAVVESFAYEAEERNPLKSLALACAMDTVPGLAEGVETLQKYPTDMRMFLMDNSHRTDVKKGPDDRHGNPQFTTVLPYDEIALRRWDGNPYAMSGGGDGTRIMAPTFWLLPYWGLRYYGAIVE